MQLDFIQRQSKLIWNAVFEYDVAGSSLLLHQGIFKNKGYIVIMACIGIGNISMLNEILHLNILVVYLLHWLIFTGSQIIKIRVFNKNRSRQRMEN